jgi:hypothetical protein
LTGKNLVSLLLVVAATLSVGTGCGKTTVKIVNRPWLGMNAAQSLRLSELVDGFTSLIAHKAVPRDLRIAKAMTLARGFRGWVEHNPNVDPRPAAVAERSATAADAFVRLLKAPSRTKLVAYLFAVRRANQALDAIHAAAVKGLPPGFEVP